MSSWNPNKIFGRLDIRTKLAIAFLLLSGIPLGLVGWYAARQHLSSLSERATQEQERSLVGLQQQVLGLLDNVRQDLDLMASSNAVQAVVRTVESGGRRPAPGVEAAVLASTFRDFLASKTHYYRLRMLDDTGTELAAVVRRQGEPRILPDGNWRGTGYLFYRRLVADEPGDDLGVAPVELRQRVEGASPGDALVAAFSFVRPLHGPDGGLRGLIVADVYAHSIFELLRPRAASAGGEIMLIGPSEHYLYHSAKKTTWNTLLAAQTAPGFQQDFASAVVEAVRRGDSGVLVEPSGAVVTFAPLASDPHTGLNGYMLVSEIPAEVVFGPVRDVRRFVLVTGGLTLLLAGILAFVAAHQFTAPIRELTRGAARLAAGDFSVRLGIETNDEIEDLSRAFTRMAGALEAREAEIVRQRERLGEYAEHLEAMVEERTRALRRSQKQLIQQEKMAAVGQLAAGIAHELGTPMATIMMHAQMAVEEIESTGIDSDSGELRNGLRTVMAESERCRDIVQNLLDFSRPSTEKKAPIELATVVQRAVELLRHDFERRGIEICVDCSGPAMAAANENEIEQVLINLLRNSADASEPGGSIHVAVRPRGGDGTRGSEGGDGREGVRVTVIDSGQGISESHRDRIFEPFFTTKPPGVGTGLGLWISYNIVAEHGGVLEVTRTGPAGTAISFLLPAADDSSMAGGAATS